MIESIFLRNFQKHKKLKIRFSPNVTTITGPNDRGKSTVHRAFRWLSLNLPSGNGFIRRSGSRNQSVKGNTIAEARIDDKRISRVRSGKRGNYYRLDGRKYSAVGRSKVPEDIANLLNIGEVNFQKQLDPPFWFLESAGQVSKNLNAIFNLDGIDKSLENIARQLRKAKATVSVTEDRLKEAKSALKKVNWVKECDMDLKGVEKAKERFNRLSDKRSRLLELVKGVKRLNRKRIFLRGAVKEGRKVVRLGDQAMENRDLTRSLGKLLERLKRYERLSSQPVPDISDLLAARVDVDKSAEDRRDLEEMVTQLKEADQWRERKRQELIEAEKSLTKLIGKVCPTCGRPFKIKKSFPSSQSQHQTCTFPQKHQ